jgi:hypothetical protein
MTATLSPLDVVINPEVKSIGMADFRNTTVERRHEGRPIDGGAESWSCATACAIASFNKIKKSTVMRSFEDSIGLGTPAICRQADIDRQREMRERREKLAAEVASALSEIDRIMLDFA